MPKFLNKSSSGPCLKATIRLLEDTNILECEFEIGHKGRYLIDYVCDHLNLAERDYFALRYVDTDKQRHWLDPGKSILKQIKDVENALFSFRVKFYPPNPLQLKEQITRYQMYLQLRRDLLHGRLHCNNKDAAFLGACIIQAELGDYNPEEHIGNYASECKIFLKQTLNIEESIIEIHQTLLKGQLLEEIEAKFLRKCCSFDSYGVDPHPVKDQKGIQSYLGVNFNGILIFQGTRKTNHFKWNEVQKINYEGKMFIIHLIYIEDSRTKKKETVGFKCPTTAACRHLWRCAVEQMLFFTSPSSSNIPRVVSGGGFFTGSKFKYAGRVEREVLEEMAQLSRQEPQIQRVGSLRRKASSVPATPSTPIVNDVLDSNSVSPRLNFNSLEKRLNFNISDQVNIQYNADGSTVLEPVVEDSEGSSSKFIKKRAEDYTTCQTGATSNIDTVNIGNFKESYSESMLYHNRDPMEHSSSESHVTGNASHRSSRSQTPVPKGNVHFSSDITFEDRYSRSTDYNYINFQNDLSTYSRMCSFFKACLPSVILTLTSLIVVMIIAFETDAEFFALLRRAPEMVLIRRQYYEPIKEQIQFLIGQILKKFEK